MTRTLILAEPGSTHEGQMDRMERLIAAAAEAGADVFKAQWVSSPERLCARRRAPEYLASYRKLAYPLAWHQAIASTCAQAGLGYGCSVYLPEDAEAVAPFVEYVKIASFELADPVLLVAARQTRRKVLLSTGMAERYAVGDACAWAQPWGLLHCVSAYPTPVAEANLRGIRTLAEDAWHTHAAQIGYSDHTLPVITGALAVTVGATILERHLRLEDTDPANADYVVASTPDEFRAYVDHVRLAEQMLGSGDKSPQPCEAPMMAYRVQP